MRTFAYDPSRSFRGWLKTVTYRAWKDFVDGCRRSQVATRKNQVWERMQALQARKELVQQLEEVFDYELLELAKLRVRLRVAPRTWEAFRLVTLAGLPVAEVAATVQMQVAMVYVAKSKVQKMLQEEIRKLEAAS
jgi:RNA polymerase sigma-70 factor (ECF subfamily)